MCRSFEIARHRAERFVIIRDAANIVRNGFDENYIKHWTAKLEVEDLLAEAFAKLEQNAE